MEVDMLIQKFFVKALLLRFLGEFAFFLESLINDYTNERAPCDTMRIGENINTERYGIATPFGSDLREAINIAVLELDEIGFLQRLKQKWFYERSECPPSLPKHSIGETRIGMANVAGIFYILFIGLCLAILIALFEFLLKTKCDSIRLNQNICKVLRRNLRISIMGMNTDDKKEAMNCLLLQQQQQYDSMPLQYCRNMQGNDRPMTTATVIESQKSNDEPIAANPTH
jgi:hypothetical protein